MLLSYFYRPLRLMLRDYDATVRLYPDGTLDDAVKTTLQFGKVGVGGGPTKYGLSVDELQVTPDPVRPEDFALLSYYSVKWFVMSAPDQYRFESRAYSERLGSLARYLTEIEADIHRLESGTAFSAWQDYYSWLHGMAGLPLGEVLAQFDVQAPLWKATFTRDGMKVA